MTHTEEQVRAYYTIIMDNNPNGVIDALNRNGYATNYNIPRSSLGSKLFSVFKRDKDLFFKMMKSVPFNEKVNNYTTSEQLANAIVNTTKAIEKNKHI